MKIGKCAQLLVAVMPFLAGCGNFWQPPSSSGGSTSTTLSSGFFYVLNQKTSQIIAYNINSGKLNQIGAYTLAAAPSAVAIAPGGSFLYVGTVAGIYLYSINSSGALTIGNNGGVVSSDPASAIAVDTSGAWLVDAVQGNNGFQLNATPITSTGTFTGGTVGTASYAVSNASVHQLVISADDLNVFVAVGTGGTAVVPFSSGNSAPLGKTATIIAPVTSGGAALSVAVDPASSPRLFYIGETLASGGNTGGLRVFNYSSLGGTLTQVSGSPFASGGLAPNAILPVATGSYVYVANGQGTSSAGNIAGFSIASSNGSYTVTTGNTASAGIQPFGLAEDSDANFVLAVSEGGSPDLDAYIFDTTTAGKLDSSITSTTGTDPTQAIAVAAAP
ncbi:MAG TPA: beta-propeller fold lactonase family protein [Terracidiphilus sp.]|nr:beta-propeller fold lactonase family protein [Terracidiphilus sp.]